MRSRNRGFKLLTLFVSTRKTITLHWSKILCALCQNVKLFWCLVWPGLVSISKGLLLYLYVLILHLKCKNQNANLGLSFFSWCCLAWRKANSTAQKKLSRALFHSPFYDWSNGIGLEISRLAKITTHLVLDDWAQKFQAFKFCSKL